jgi:signal transduction histidine kinase
MNTLLERMVSERTSDLEEVNAVLEESREEISLQKEELESQYETLEETNNTLIMQKEQIEAQNRELDQHRFNLQLLVNERTKELEKALYKAEESERLKSSFLANMSHEIRTPMNAIIGFSIMLRQKDLPEDEKDEFIKIIMSNSESLLVLINDIMDLSKIQASQMVLYPTSVPLVTLLNELKDVYTVEAEKKNLSIKFAKHAISNEYTLYTDKVRLKQVIGNLITNAIKFTSEGEIEFGLNILPDIITFYVKDTGVGISPEVGDAIFERFLKLENTEKLFGGTGLGLAICKSLVEQWGGTIWYESELNAGTTFYFTHPVSNTSETI